MSTLIIYEIAYRLPETRREWMKRFFYSSEAQAFIATLAKEDFLRCNETKTNSPIFTEARGTPYRYLAGTHVTLGDFHDVRHVYRTTAYTTEELFDVAKREFDSIIAIERKQQDAYYSQPWV